MNRSGVPQIDDGNWFKLSNELQEALSMAKLTASEYAVIGLYMRLCYGWKDNKLTVKLPGLISLEIIGIKKQNARHTLEQMKEKNLITHLKIPDGGGEVSFRFNKRYKTWKVDMTDKWIEYDALIKLNKPRGARDEDECGNMDITENDIGNTGITDGNMDITSGNTDITESNMDITSTPSEPAETQGVTDAKDIKDSLKTISHTIVNKVTRPEGQNENPENGNGGMVFSKEKKTEQELGAVTDQLRYHQVRGPIRLKIAAEYDTQYIYRQIKQLRKDFDKGQRFSNPGGVLVARIKSGHRTEDYLE